MTIPSQITDLSETAASNSPAGTESVGPNMNAYIQAAYAFIRQIYDGKLNPIATVNLNGQSLTGLAAGVNPTDAPNMSNLGAYLLLAGGAITGSLSIGTTLAVTGATTLTGQLSCNNVTTKFGNGQASVINMQVSNNNTLGGWFLDMTGNVGFFDTSRSLTRFQCDTSGNFSAAGNITSNSDERLKKDWTPLAHDFIQKLSSVKSGTYSRKDIQLRQAGVGAQSLRQVLPEAVSGDDILSVAYGQAALVAAVELAKEVVFLRQRIAALEARP